jgi:hypothetical protein
MQIPKISCPAHACEVLRFINQRIATTKQNNRTTSERIEVFPSRGSFKFFWPHLLHLLVMSVTLILCIPCIPPMTKNMVRIKINHDDMKKKSKTRNVDADMTKITAPIALISRVSSSAPPLVASTFEDFCQNFQKI